MAAGASTCSTTCVEMMTSALSAGHWNAGSVPSRRFRDRAGFMPRRSQRALVIAACPASRNLRVGNAPPASARVRSVGFPNASSTRRCARLDSVAPRGRSAINKFTSGATNGKTPPRSRKNPAGGLIHGFRARQLTQSTPMAWGCRHKVLCRGQAEPPPPAAPGDKTVCRGMRSFAD